MVKRIIVLICRTVAFMIALIPICCVKIEEKLSTREEVFQFWGEFFAVFPGLPGSFIRSIFYKFTIKHCSSSARIYHSVSIAHRETSIGRNVIITSFTTVGRCYISDGAGIGSGCHIISGKMEHTLNSEGIDFSIPMKGSHVKIGKKVFIGDGCIIMADVGDGAVIGAGSVVVRDIPPYSIAVGNPASVVKTWRSM